MAINTVVVLSATCEKQGDIQSTASRDHQNAALLRIRKKIVNILSSFRLLLAREVCKSAPEPRTTTEPDMMRLAYCAALIAVMAGFPMLVACTTVNDGEALEQTFATAPSVSRAQIYMYRGGFNGVFSTGINEMAADLNSKGVPAKAVSWSAKDKTLAQIRAARAKGGARPIILVGHSLGASVVIAMANDLTEAGIPVDLVITLDPLYATTVPKGVRRFVNFKASGSKDNPGRFSPGPGFDGEIVNVDVRNLPKLEKSSHWNIVNQSDLQTRVMREIRNAYRRGG